MQPKWDSRNPMHALPPLATFPPLPTHRHPPPLALFPLGRLAYGKRQELIRGGDGGASVRRSPYFCTARGAAPAVGGSGEVLTRRGRRWAPPASPPPAGDRWLQRAPPPPAASGNQGGPVRDGHCQLRVRGQRDLVWDSRPKGPAAANEYPGGQKNAPVPRGPRGPWRAGRRTGPGGQCPAGLRDPPEHGRSGGPPRGRTRASVRGSSGCGGRTGWARRAEASRGTGPSLAPR